MSKRVKECFTSGEIPHKWAHQTQEHGRVSGGSIKFNGTQLIHYSTTIGNIIKYKGKKAFVCDTAQFSITTSQHQSAMRRAIPSSEKTFDVHCGHRGQSLEFTPQTLRDYYLADYRKRGTPSKFAFKRASDFLTRLEYLDQAISVCEFFNLPVSKLDNKRTKQAMEKARCEKLIAEREEKLKVAREYRVANWDKIQAAKLTKKIKQAITIAAGDLSQIENLDETFLYRLTYFGRRSYSNRVNLLDSRPDLQSKIDAEKVRRNAVQIEKWIAGEISNYQLPRECPVVLRVKSDTQSMETSKGVRIPLNEAQLAFRFVSKHRETGWHKNGTSFAIGEFQLDAVNESGIVAGCHRIAWNEIERFAKSQNWIAA